MRKGKAWKYRKYALKGTWFSLIFMGSLVFKLFKWLSHLREEAISRIGQCPKCNSLDVEYGEMVLKDEQVYYHLTCNNCDTKSKEWYGLTYIETIPERKTK